MTGSPKHILVIDDSEDIREFYRSVLEDAGYSVSLAANGQDGLEAVRAHRPDLLVVDVVMPVMDGLEFLYRLRSDIAPPIPTAILCSGFQLTSQEAAGCGAYAFVPKPISIPEFLVLVERALANEGPDEGTLTQLRERSELARKSAARWAEEATSPSTVQDLDTRVKGALEFLRDYFTVDEAFLAFLRNGRPVMISGGTTSESMPEPSAAGLLPPSIAEIVETGSTLLLPDALSYRSLVVDLRALQGVRSFVGVPMLNREGRTTGALCLARRVVEPFPAEDVMMIEQTGRLGSMLIGLAESGKADPFRGVGLIGLPRALRRNSFELLVDLELRLAFRKKNALELALIDLGKDFDGKAAEAIRLAGPPDRMAIGVFGPRRIGLVKRGRDQQAVSRQIDDSVAALRRLMTIGGAGAVVVASSVSAVVESKTLIQLADRQLDQRRSGIEGVERLHLGYELAADHL